MAAALLSRLRKSVTQKTRALLRPAQLHVLVASALHTVFALVSAVYSCAILSPNPFNVLADVDWTHCGLSTNYSPTTTVALLGAVVHGWDKPGVLLVASLVAWAAIWLVAFTVADLVASFSARHVAQSKVVNRRTPVLQTAVKVCGSYAALSLTFPLVVVYLALSSWVLLGKCVSECTLAPIMNSRLDDLLPKSSGSKCFAASSWFLVWVNLPDLVLVRKNQPHRIWLASDLQCQLRENYRGFSAFHHCHTDPEALSNRHCRFPNDEGASAASPKGLCYPPADFPKCQVCQQIIYDALRNHSQPFTRGFAAPAVFGGSTPKTDSAARTAHVAAQSALSVEFQPVGRCERHAAVALGELSANPWLYSCPVAKRAVPTPRASQGVTVDVDALHRCSSRLDSVFWFNTSRFVQRNPLRARGRTLDASFYRSIQAAVVLVNTREQAGSALRSTPCSVCVLQVPKGVSNALHDNAGFSIVACRP